MPVPARENSDFLSQIRAERQARAAQQNFPNGQNQNGLAPKQSDQSSTERNQKRYVPAPVPDEAQRARLTPEDRRTLRRSINEAGRDLYAPPPRP